MVIFENDPLVNHAETILEKAMDANWKEQIDTKDVCLVVQAQ